MNPPAIPADTTPEAWAIHCAANRARTPEQNMKLLEQLLNELAIMEERAIRRQYPKFSDIEVRIEIIRRRHGEEAAKNCVPILIRNAHD